MNPMTNLRIEKITLNIGVGGAGDKLDKALKLLEKITNAKPIRTITMKRIPSWGVRPKLPIGAKITLRGKKAEGVLIRLLKSVDNKINLKKFDNTGNLSFGVKEYLDIPDVEYDPTLGIMGLEVAITLEKPGFRIKRRRLRNAKPGHKHLITKQESIDFMKKHFNVNIVEEENEL